MNTKNSSWLFGIALVAAISVFVGLTLIAVLGSDFAADKVTSQCVAEEYRMYQKGDSISVVYDNSCIPEWDASH